MKRYDAAAFLVPPDSSVRLALNVIDKNKEGIALVAGSDRRLLGLITDGDIRRFMLRGNSLDRPCSEAMCATPFTLSEKASPEEIVAGFSGKRIRHIPLLDQNRVAIALVCQFAGAAEVEARTAVIMAGGEGRRLRPITESIPKPMIQIKGRPLLEITIERLVSYGIRRIILAVNYKANIIEDHFGDGARFGVQVEYLREKQKLGTVGALALLDERPRDPFLVMNGDIITDIDIRRFLDFHTSHRSILTIASIQYNMNIPFGVLEHSGPFVLSVTEKPSHSFLCNAGMYVVDPELIDRIPAGTYYDMTSLVSDLIASGLAVHTFPIHESWIDVGQKKDLIQADGDYSAAIVDG